jgi:hypothetical protein
MLERTDSHRLPAVRSLADAARARPTATTAGALIGLAVLSSLLRAIVIGWVHGPFVFLDELGYEQMARSFARTGHFAIFGKQGLAYSPLYPIALSPVYALTSSAQTAYEWVKVVNSVLMSLSVFPVYAIARFLLSRKQALGVAVLALIAPLMSYTGLEFSENLAYPLFLVAVWRLLCALRESRPRNDALLLVAIAFACAARLEAVVLVPAALTAILLVGIRRDGLRRLLAQHRLVFVAVALGLVAVLARTAQNGGSIPLAGRYAAVGHARPSVVHVLRIALDHIAGFDLALGVVPFACALAAGYALYRAGFPTKAFMWGAVAAATTFWLLLEVALDAAAFDTGHRLPNGRVSGDLPRIHERYLIYLVPFFLVALVALVGRAGSKLSRRSHLAVAALAAALPAVIPFARDINYTSIPDSPSLQLLGTVKHGVVMPGTHPVATALAISVLLAGVYLLGFLDRRPPLAVAVTALAFVALSVVAMARITSAASGSTSANLPTQRNWVDVAGRHDVALVSGGTHRVAVLETAFNNFSISRLYYVCRPAFEPDFGELPLSVGPGGRLSLRARFVVAPISFTVRGRVLARDQRGGLELVAPPGGVAVVQRRISC